MLPVAARRLQSCLQRFAGAADTPQLPHRQNDAKRHGDQLKEQQSEIRPQENLQQRGFHRQRHRHQHQRHQQNGPTAQPAPAQRLLPRHGVDFGVGIGLRRGRVVAIEDLIALLTGRGKLPAQVRVGIDALFPRLALHGPLVLDTDAAVLRLRLFKSGEPAVAGRDAPAFLRLVLQPAFDGGGVPPLLRGNHPFLLHRAPSSLSPSATHSFNRASSCRNRARPRAVMA